VENLDGRRFCGECGAALDALPVEPVTPPMCQARSVTTTPYFSEKTKKRLAVGAIVVAVVLIIASILGYFYYHQPVMGSGSASATTIDVGQMVLFSFTPTQGVSPYQYSWNFGDGGFSSEQNPGHSYDSPGTYLPLVTVSNSAGETTTWTTTVEVNPLPSVEGVVSPSVGVTSLNVSFTATAWGGTPDFSYSWRFGDGTSSIEQNPTHSYSLGEYTATVTVQDGVGMTASWSAKVSVNLPLTVGVIVGWIGPGDTESFSCTPSQGVTPYSFYWVFGDGLSSTLQNFTYNYGSAGTTTVYLTVTDSIGETFEFEKFIEY